MNKRILLVFNLLFYTIALLAQQKQSPEEYIAKYYKIAVKQMHLHKIPASITLAQGILESGSGNSVLAQKAKNHFGIKCHSNWEGKRFFMDDDAKDECFRVYKNPIESYQDHSLFLSKRGRYSFLFTDYKITDYKKWAYGLKKAGYATNPKYPQLLIDLIERYKLFQYDKNKFIPDEPQSPDLIVLEDIEDENFELELTDAYIKALMGKTVYYSDAIKGIFIFNRIKTIKAKNRTPLEIALAYNVNFEQLLKFNDIMADDRFLAHQNVFLQPKRYKGIKKKYLVKPGDSMWEISQMFGIKLKSLYKKNLLQLHEEVAPGETVYLRKKTEKKPKTITYEEFLKLKRKQSLENTKSIEVKENNNLQKEKSIKNKEVQKENEAILIHDKIKQQERIKEENAYKANKYIDKNEEVEKALEQIPVKKKEDYLSSTQILHTVQQGETLYFLSKKYNVSIEDLKKWNRLQDNNISINQELIVSQF